MPAIPFLRSRKRRGLYFANGLADFLLRRGRFTPLDPFGFWVGHRSLLSREGGDAESAIAGYAFQTDYVSAVGGRVGFRLHLHGLAGSRGSLLLTLSSIDAHGMPGESREYEIPIPRLIARRGRVILSQPAAPDHAYALAGALVGGSDARADHIEVDVAGRQDQEFVRARVRHAREDFLDKPGEDGLARLIVNQPPSLERPISQMCTAGQLNSPLFTDLCVRLGLVPKQHRKHWEFAFVVRALEHHGALRPGARGLGFGVGIETLPSYFASLGCEIVATDLSLEDDRARLWQGSSQLTASLRQLFHPQICDESAFFERVTFRPVDMNAIPADLAGFDFTWSSCAFEHLGSIAAGLDFYENSLACLKPGGIAVHTTELNLSSNDRTLDHASTVLFRRRDFEALARRLIAKGHDVLPITFDAGDGELDQIIDMPPYANDPHLKLALLSWVTTSFGFITRKAALHDSPRTWQQGS
jgi:hypothetical protein